MRDFKALCWYYRGCGKVVKTGWHVVLPLFFYLLLNMFRATMCPSSGADNCVILYPCFGRCRACGKVVKTGWQLVRPLLFY